MKLTTPAFLCASLALALFACKKTNESHSLLTTTADSGIAIHYSMAGTTDTSVHYELVFCETDGQVLLDTLMPYNVILNTTLNTTHKYIDLTTIQYYAAYKQLHFYTQRTFDPTTLKPDTTTYVSNPVQPDATLLGNLTYINTPSTTSYTPFLGVPALAPTDIVYSMSYPSESSIDVNNLYYAPGKAAYLAYPDLGLYNFHKIQGGNDTVDLTHMDSSVQVSFIKPSKYYAVFSDLYGWVDTADENSYVQLSPGVQTGALSNVDFIYPGTNKDFQGYYLDYYAQSDDYQYLWFSCYNCRTIPNNFELPNSTWYNFTSTQTDNISWTYAKGKPDAYGVYLGSSTADESVDYTLLQGATDSTTVNPITYLNTIHPKMVPAATINQLSLDGIQFTYVIDDKIETQCQIDFNMASRQAQGARSKAQSFLRNQLPLNIGRQNARAARFAQKINRK